MIVPIVLAVTIIIFTLMYFVPGDPATIAASGEQVSQEQPDQIPEDRDSDGGHIKIKRVPA